MVNTTLHQKEGDSIVRDWNLRRLTEARREANIKYFEYQAKEWGKTAVRIALEERGLGNYAHAIATAAEFTRKAARIESSTELRN